jgi:hypothetical protein
MRPDQYRVPFQGPSKDRELGISFPHRCLILHMEDQLANVPQSPYFHRALVDRVARSWKSSGISPLVLTQFGALSAAGLALYLYDAAGSKRWYSRRKLQCDSSPEFMRAAKGASVVVNPRSPPRNPKQHFTSEDVDEVEDVKSGKQDVPSQDPVEEKADDQSQVRVDATFKSIFHLALGFKLSTNKVLEHS